MVNHFRGVMRQQQSSSLFYRNRRYRNTRGAAGIEYCLLLALFAVAIIPATQALRFEIENTLIPYQTDGGTAATAEAVTRIISRVKPSTNANSLHQKLLAPE